ncbi:hypothetical protein Glo7428_1098 [Gloeocapsa sp. PCC 7428]|uniref:peptidylprolyl isomerase n=1 Tax=Gloeocapsa sp. PCC 7428 TaxID=1173026 RepID=UPI0002A5BEB1|nr:peptidylprolyl isomerase [Gloeocapsa sp. PCC 7428]AFZ29671.1 hypothetical protein Glo7428_1098 [Gloeocapsa sp. PCC 7428]
MATALQTSHTSVVAGEIISLLKSCQILPQLWRENIIEQAIATIDCTPEEMTNACQQFYQQHQLDSVTKQQAWLEHYGITQAQLVAMATRELKIEKFKQLTWGSKLESYFLERKGQLDRVICSLIRVQDRGLAEEIYFRIHEKEQSFIELAKQFSVGLEAHTGGIVGPVELGTLHPQLARTLKVNRPGQVLRPILLGEWIFIVRLEKFIPAQLDEIMRRKLLQELFTAWLQEQMQKSPSFDKIWLKNLGYIH